MTVELPIKTVSESNQPSPGNWRATAGRRKRQRKAAAMLMLAANRFRPQPPMRITLTRLGAKRMDCDNLRSALKGCRDGIADYLDMDDGDTRLTWDYRQEIDGKRNGKRGVRVEIVETDE